MSRLYWSNLPKRKAHEAERAPVKFIDDRRLADAGISRDKHQLWCPPLHDAIEGGEQRLDLARPSVELLRNQQPVRYVVSSERELSMRP